MSKLTKAVKLVGAALGGSGDGAAADDSTAPPRASLRGGAEEGQVLLTLHPAADNQAAKVTLQLLFFEPGEYPRSGVLVQVDEAASSRCPPGAVEKLSALSERFQDGGQLSAIIAKACGVLAVPISEEPMRAADRKAQGGGGGDGSGSGMEEGGLEDAASAEPMSEDFPSDDDDDSDGGYGGSGDEEDKELMIECGQRQGRWARYEEELEASSAGGSAAGLSMEQDKASKQQIFSTQEAFRMLSNELLGFVRRQATGEDLNVSADSAGDDVYTWNVWLWKTAFKQDSRLAKDLQEVSSKFAVSSIQLRVTFLRGLHPFYPPALEVVRPHLALPLPGALSSHLLLRLENWDPTLTMRQLVDNVRAFLEEHGAIDVANPRNSEADYPDSAFSPAAAALARLEALTDVKPACYSRFHELYEARATHGRPQDDADAQPEEPAAVTKKARTGAAAGDAAGAGGAAAAAAGATGGAAAAGAAGAAAAGVVWAKGTGYGYGGGYRGAALGPVWDSKAAAAAQEAQDEQRHGLLVGLAAALRQELGSGDGAEPMDATPSQPAAAAAAGTSSRRGHAAAAAAAAAGGGDGGADDAAATALRHQQECLDAVQASVLLPLLARELSQVSFTEMVDRHHYFQPLLAIVDALCCPAGEHLLAGNATPAAAQQEPQGGARRSSDGSGSSAQQPERVCSIVAAMRGLQKSAQLFRDRMSKVLEQQAAAKAAAPSSSSAARKVDKQAEALQQQATRSLEIAGQALGIIDKLQHLTTAEEQAAAAAAAAAAQPPQQPAAAAAASASGQRATRRTTRSSAAAAAAAAAAPAAPAAAQPTAAAAAAAPADPAASAAAYIAALKPFVLDSAPIAAFHKFKEEAGRDPMGLKARVQKVTSEMAGVERLVDVNESSSIFVRVDDDNTFLWRALITGPEDTPYSGGCFVFDIFFPPNYPAVPPKVLITTTGGGSVRFNPNLYNCGKVCLSLLGTWSGGQGEGWSPEVSSVLQVLVSIQSLILVEHPYFNEPGYEQRGDMTASKAYNAVIREKTVQWAMLDQLRKPPAEFAEPIRAHFRLRGPFILRQIDAWIGEATGAHAATLRAHRAALEVELAKL